MRQQKKIMANNLKNIWFIDTRISNAGLSPVSRLIFINAGVKSLKLVNSLIFGQDALET